MRTKTLLLATSVGVVLLLHRAAANEAQTQLEGAPSHVRGGGGGGGINLNDEDGKTTSSIETSSFQSEFTAAITTRNDRDMQSCIPLQGTGCSPNVQNPRPCCDLNVNECRNNRCYVKANTCQDRFQTCTQNSQCCQPWVCRSGQCDTAPNQCSPLNGFCQSSVDCCSTLQCNSQGRCVRGGPSNCGGLDAFCNFNSDCCAPTYECNFNTGRCDFSGSGNCGQLWEQCFRNSDCCTNLSCRQNQCNRPSCALEGQSCRNSADCCSGKPCSNGVCGGSSVGCTSLNCRQCLNSGSQPGTQACSWSPSVGCVNSCNDVPSGSRCFFALDYSPQDVCPGNVGCTSLNCRQCLNSGIQGGTQTCAWSPSVGCVNNCNEAPADASCFPSVNYSPQGICPGSSNCTPLNGVCNFDSDCCNTNRNYCQGRRCTRRSSGGGCTDRPGATCRTDSDCCGPNLICDRNGLYCRY